VLGSVEEFGLLHAIFVGLRLLGVNFVYFIRNTLVIRTLLLKWLSKKCGSHS